MKRNTIAIVCITLAALTLFASCAPAIAYAEVDPSTQVNIPDAGLREGVLETLHLSEGDKLTAGGMRKIEHLSLDRIENDEGHLSNDVFSLSGIEYASNLKSIQILYNNAGGLDLRPLSGLTDLNYILMVHDNIGDISPLKGLKNLTLLHIYLNNISDITPLSGLTNLKNLNLDYNNISDISPLKGLENLKELSLVSNRISDISPLKGLKNLERLTLCNSALGQNKIQDFSPLSELTNLKSLHLGYTGISDISPLKGLTNLEYLNLESYDEISDISLLLELPKLKKLVLGWDTYDNNPDIVKALEQKGCKVSEQ